MGVDGSVSDGPVDILSFATDFLLQSPENLNCTDDFGNIVVDGAQFVPNVDPCWTCHCQNGVPVMCKSVQCSPPTCRIVKVINTECCKFVCIDLPHDTENFQNADANRASFGVRLVASIVTSLIIIFLLVFMVHRLRRRRRTMINIRRLNEERRSENDDLVYMTNADTVDVGFELPPYEDLPPPYSPAKPWDISDESPPPYEPHDGIIQANEAPLPWRLTNTRRDGMSFPLQVLLRSLPNASSTDSCMTQPASEDVIENVTTEDTEMTERTRSVADLDSMSQFLCEHVSPPRTEVPSETCVLQSVVTVLDNGSHSSQILRENFNVGNISRRANDSNGNTLESSRVMVALSHSDAFGDARRIQSQMPTIKDEACSNVSMVEGIPETTRNTVGLMSKDQTCSIANVLRATNNQHSSNDETVGTSHNCLLAEASTENFRVTSAANAWLSSGMAKRRYLDDAKQLPKKIHLNKIWCEL